MSIREDLKAFVDGELTLARAEEVRLAVDADPALQQEVHYMKLLSENIREEATEPEVLGIDKALGAIESPKKKLPFWLGRGTVSGSGSMPRKGRVAKWVAYPALGLGVLVLASLMSGALHSHEDALTASVASTADETIAAKNRILPPIDQTVSNSASPSAPRQAPTLASPGSDSFGAAGSQAKASAGRAFSEGMIPGGHGASDGGALKKMDSAGGERTNMNGGFVPVVPKSQPLHASSSRDYVTPQSDRKIIQNGDVEVEVADVAGAQSQAARIAASFNGFTENSSLSYNEESTPTASITLRVPASMFGLALQQVEALGKVKSNNVTGQDVTAQTSDTDARLKELGAEEDDYVTMLRGARTIGQILEIKDRLSNVKQEIASLKEQLNDLKDQSAMSTLNVTFDQKPKVGGTNVPQKVDHTDDTWAEDTFATAANGLTSTMHFLGRGLIFLFVYAPIWLPIAAIAWFINRRKKLGG